jgi:hypothetical protein
VGKENHLPLVGNKLQSVQHPDYSLGILLTGIQKWAYLSVVSAADDITIK